MPWIFDLITPPCTYTFQIYCGKICIHLYTMNNNIRLVKDSSNDICELFFFFLIFFIKACYGYSFELHRQVDAIQMGTHMSVQRSRQKVHWLLSEDWNCLTVIGVCAVIWGWKHMLWGLIRSTSAGYLLLTEAIIDKLWTQVLRYNHVNDIAVWT